MSTTHSTCLIDCRPLAVFSNRLSLAFEQFPYHIIQPTKRVLAVPGSGVGGLYGFAPVLHTLVGAFWWKFTPLFGGMVHTF